MIHHLAEVQSKNIGNYTKVWQFVVILENAKIGSNCNINVHVFIENDVEIGNNVTIKSGVQIWDGITLEDNVFIGPNATFTNDKTPRSKVYPESFPKTIVHKFATIGANATLLPGLIIGEYALVGAGAVVTKNVLPYQILVGNPAKLVGYITKYGTKVNLSMEDEEGNKYIYEDNKLKTEE